MVCSSQYFLLHLNLFVYLYPIFQGLIRFWLRLIGAYITLNANKNIFVNHGEHRWKLHNQLPALHVNFFSTYAIDERPFSWYTDGIPVVVDNYAMSIIGK